MDEFSAGVAGFIIGGFLLYGILLYDRDFFNVLASKWKRFDEKLKIKDKIEKENNVELSFGAIRTRRRLDGQTKRPITDEGIKRSV